MNEMQARFCAEYIIDLNATQAAKRAGYSEKTSYSHGQRLLKDVEIQAEIARLKEKREIDTDINAAWVLKKLFNLAEISVGEFLNTSSKMPFIDLSNATPEQLKLVESITVETYIEGRGKDAETVKRIKLTLPSKLKAVGLIAKHVDINAFVNNFQFTGPGGGPIQLTHNATAATAAVIDGLKAARVADGDKEES